MKLADLLLDELFAPDAEQIQIAFNQKLDELGYIDVNVDSVDVHFGGDVVVTFTDGEGDMPVLFTLDDDDGAVAIVLADEFDYLDDEDDEIDYVDLDALDPKTMDYGDGNIGIDLTDLSWLNDSGLTAILGIGDLLDDEVVEPSQEDVSESRMAMVIRGGKRVKLALVRRRRRKRMTSKQKLAIRKAVITRRKKRAQITRKLKKAFKARKRFGIKRSSTATHKVAGTSDRKGHGAS